MSIIPSAAPNNTSPTPMTSFLVAMSGGDLPADAVREERCLREPIGCGKPLISKSGEARVFWDEDEAAQYEAEWQITGLCPDCQDRLTDTAEIVDGAA